MRARARKVSGGWRLSGTKLWITHAPIADLMIVWAKDDDGVIRGFILERGMTGLTTAKIEGKMSVRASPTGEIAMDDVFVPDDNILPGATWLEWPVRLPEQRPLRYLLGRLGSRRVLLGTRPAIT